MKKIFILAVLFLTSCSKLVFPDGVGRVTLKNGSPCLYLNNGKSIIRVGYEVNAPIITNMPNGSSREQCVVWADSQVNTPLNVALFSANTSDPHIIDFCVEQKNQQLRLVQVQKNQEGVRVCSDLAWKPVKYYFGVFAEVERFWDWLFNLNGYTKETF